MQSVSGCRRPLRRPAQGDLRDPKGRANTSRTDSNSSSAPAGGFVRRLTPTVAANPRANPGDHLVEVVEVGLEEENPANRTGEPRNHAGDRTGARRPPPEEGTEHDGREGGGQPRPGEEHEPENRPDFGKGEGRGLRRRSQRS